VFKASGKLIGGTYVGPKWVRSVFGTLVENIPLSFRIYSLLNSLIVSERSYSREEANPLKD